VNAAHEGGATIATGGRPGLPGCRCVGLISRLETDRLDRLSILFFYIDGNTFHDSLNNLHTYPFTFLILDTVSDLNIRCEP